MEHVNMDTLDGVLDRYQEHLRETRKDEIYKWAAVQHFREVWDPGAQDLSAMLCDAFQVDHNPKLNLVFGPSWFPIGMLDLFMKDDPQGTLEALEGLWDEQVDLRERMVAFEAWAAGTLARFNERRVANGENPARNHFQDTRSMSCYLAFMHPEANYYYKTNMYREAAKFLGIGYPGNKFDKVIAYREMCGQILERLVEAHPTLVDESDGMLRESEYGDLTEFDPSHHMLVQDVVYFITHYDKQYRDVGNSVVDIPGDEWFPSEEEYDPGIDADGWEELLGNPEVFTESSLVVMSRFMDAGGAATCSQLSKTYGEPSEYYISNSVFLAKRVQKATGCPTMPKTSSNSRWWPILYVGRRAIQSKGESGNYVWRLRDELAEALGRVELPQAAPETVAQDSPGGYWWLNANPRIWSFASVGVGDVETYTLYNEKGHKRRIHQNFLDARPGDPIVGYATSPIRKVVALGRVVSEQDGEFIYFEKTEDLENPVDFADIQSCPALSGMEYLSNPQGSLFRLTEDEYDAILELAGVEDGPVGEENAETSVVEPYDRERFLSEVYMSEPRYERLEALLKRKRNVILQGAPGVGKTYCARRLAWSMMGCKDNSRIEMVQLHQSYTYEDFVMGWRPEDEGFKLRHGVFHRFCTRAANHPNQEYYFIIDEINRGNLSKVFGELLMLIEADHRGDVITLAYDGQPFCVPENLLIIGMMNTADRSLTGIDYALRRRFSFFEMEPAFGSEGFRRHQEEVGSEDLDALVDQIRALNVEITSDPTLGRGYRIGHSYLCGDGADDDGWLRDVVECDIVPMLEEYWFDDPGKARDWEARLLGALSQ